MIPSYHHWLFLPVATAIADIKSNAIGSMIYTNCSD